MIAVRRSRATSFFCECAVCSPVSRLTCRTSSCSSMGVHRASSSFRMEIADGTGGSVRGWRSSINTSARGSFGYLGWAVTTFMITRTITKNDTHRGRVPSAQRRGSRRIAARADDAADAAHRRRNRAPRSTRSVNSRAPGTVAFRPLISHLCAGGSGVGVSHYDRGYDTLAARTDPHFASVWLARRVSL